MTSLRKKVNFIGSDIKHHIDFTSKKKVTKKKSETVIDISFLNNDKNNYIFVIPIELLKYIFELLDYEILRKCELVCELFHINVRIVRDLRLQKTNGCPRACGHTHTHHVGFLPSMMECTSTFSGEYFENVTNEEKDEIFFSYLDKHNGKLPVNGDLIHFGDGVQQIDKDCILVYNSTNITEKSYRSLNHEMYHTQYEYPSDITLIETDDDIFPNKFKALDFPLTYWENLNDNKTTSIKRKKLFRNENHIFGLDKDVTVFGFDYTPFMEECRKNLQMEEVNQKNGYPTTTFYTMFYTTFTYKQEVYKLHISSTKTRDGKYMLDIFNKIKSVSNYPNNIFILNGVKKELKLYDFEGLGLKPQFIEKSSSNSNDEFSD